MKYFLMSGVLLVILGLYLDSLVLFDEWSFAGDSGLVLG